MECASVVKKVRDSVAVVICDDGKGNIPSKGSGFVYFKKGIIVTCNHVVAIPDTAVKIRFDDEGDFIEAKIALQDLEHDIAILKYNPSQAPKSEPLDALSEKDVQEGMAVIFAGYPLNLWNLTTHQGILSAIIKDATGAIVYMIDGTVNSGNSGCPLLSDSGKVIGVVNARRRENHKLLSEIESIEAGAISIHNIDVIKTYKAIISNLQMGMGYAIPSSYIPKYDSEPPAPGEPKLQTEEVPVKVGGQVEIVIAAKTTRKKKRL